MNEQSSAKDDYIRFEVMGELHLIRKRSPEELKYMEARDREEQERKRRARVSVIDIPGGYKNASLESPLQTAALNHVRSYLAEGLTAGGCLVLCGPTGVGKTYAACAALLTAVCVGLRFFHFPTFCHALENYDSQRAALTLAKTVKFAVWDDFGAEHLKKGGCLNALIDELVWHREAERLPTIITTNLTPDQLRERLSDRILDRFAGDWGQIFQVPGESLRRGDGGKG